MHTYIYIQALTNNGVYVRLRVYHTKTHAKYMANTGIYTLFFICTFAYRRGGCEACGWATDYFQWFCMFRVVACGFLCQFVISLARVCVYKKRVFKNPTPSATCFPEAYMYIYMYIYICIYIYIYTNINTYTNTQTYTHTYTYT